MGMPLIQPSFAAGEIAPALHARVDLAKYQIGLATCVNWMIMAQGGAQNRPGTLWVGPCLDHATRSRLIPFQFSTTQAYALEFGALKMRVIKDGGYVTDGTQKITGITQANPGVVTIVGHGWSNGDVVRLQDIVGMDALNGVSATLAGVTANTFQLSGIDTTAFAAYISGGTATRIYGITGITQANPGVVTIAHHGWSNGDLVYISGVAGMTEVDGRFFTIAGVTTDTFQLAGVNTSAYAAYTSGGTAARVYTLATPYAAADLPRLKFTQSADTMTLTHPGYAPRDLTRTGHASWSLSTITFAAEQLAPTGVTATPSSVSGATSWTYVVSAVNADTGEESLPSSGGSCTFKAESAWNAAGGDFITVTWANIDGAGSYNVYKQRNGIFGFVGNAGSGAAGFVDDKLRADTTDAPPGPNNPFNGAGKYPGCVNYHEQRKFFGGSTSKPQTIWATASGSYKNMNVSTPTQDDDAITRTIASRQVNEIRHLVSMGALIVFTSGAEWMCWPGSQSDVLTPANTNLRAQSYAGANHVPPIVVNDSILFVQEKGSIVRDLKYQFESEGWTGVDLSVLAAHLFEGRAIEEWAWAQVPHKIIWAVRDDGVLLALTYMREHEVFAWARHVTDGVVESVCTIGEGDEDVLYLCVARVVGGQTVRYVERLQSRRFARLRDAWFLDCALAYDGNNSIADDTLRITGASYTMGATVTLQATGHAPFSAALVGRQYELRAGEAKVRVTVTAYGDTDTLTARLETNAPDTLCDVATADWALLASSVGGLWHLEGRAVDIFADGNKMPGQTVIGGRVTLERAASRALVGLPYDCDLETLNVDAGQPTLQGRRARVGTVTLRLLESRGLLAGPDVDALIEMKERATEAYGEPIALYTGDRDLLIEPRWNDGGRVHLRATPGLPATVLAIIPRIDAGG